MTDLESAWAQLDAANATLRWYVGQPSPPDELRRAQWTVYAFDPTEKAKAGARSREWTAVGRSEVEVVREIARGLREISEGRVPR